jgi:hypothetical protein
MTTVYGNKDWQEADSQIGTWFISGQIEYFENFQQALDWLNV